MVTIMRTGTLTITMTPMLEYDFMRTAFAAAGVAAILAGTVGFFLVLRGQTFAGHALSHVGFTGATGALLLGLSPLAGLVGFTLVAGIGMGLFGEKLAQRDVAIGMMLSLALGLGLLFLHFYTAAATQAAALLFGNVLGVDSSALLNLVLLAILESRRARPHRAAAGFRLPAGGARRGARRTAALRLGGFSRDRGGRGRGVRADRRRPLGFHPDGWPGGGGGESDPAAAGGDHPFRRPRARRGLGRPDARILYRLANELLDHRIVWHRVLRRRRRAAIRGLTTGCQNRAKP